MRRGVWALLSSVGFPEVSPAQGAGAPGAGRRGGQAKVHPPAGFAPRLPFHGSFLYSFSGFLSGPFPCARPIHRAGLP